MNVQDNFERQVASWLAEGPHQLPETALDRILGVIDQTDTWRPTWLPRRETMNRTILAAGSLAAVVLLAVIGFGLWSGGGMLGPGATTSPTSSPEPTVSTLPSASPRPATEGELQPGTYILDPLQAADNPLTVTFTVPEGWEVIGGNNIISERAGDILGIQLEDITSLNGDPCDWTGTADDVSVGTTVDDLVEALGAQTAYGVSEPVDVTISGYSGTRVDIVHPTEPFTGRGNSEAPGCDDGRYRIWSSAVHGPDGVYAQGPANRWQANILDVEGTRLVIVASDFPDTAAEDRAEMHAIIDSFVIQPGD